MSFHASFYDRKEKDHWVFCLDVISLSSQLDLWTFIKWLFHLHPIFRIKERWDFYAVYRKPWNQYLLWENFIVILKHVSFLRISSAMYFLAYSVWYRGTELFTEIIMKTSSCWIESFLTCGVACYWVQTEVATRKYIFEIIALPTYYSISAGLFLMLVCWWTQYCYAIASFHVWALG